MELLLLRKRAVSRASHGVLLVLLTRGVRLSGLTRGFGYPASTRAHRYPAIGIALQVTVYTTQVPERKHLTKRRFACP